MIRRICFSLSWVVFGLLAAAGCSSEAPVGQVTGAVKYKGVPVTTGDVNLYRKEKGAGAMAALDAGGRFAITTPLETGTYEVYITPPSPEPGVPAPKSGPLVPKKFWQAATSGLTVEVLPGSNDLTIELKD